MSRTCRSGQVVGAETRADPPHSVGDVFDPCLGCPRRVAGRGGRLRGQRPVREPHPQCPPIGHGGHRSTEPARDRHEYNRIEDKAHAHARRSHMVGPMGKLKLYGMRASCAEIISATLSSSAAPAPAPARPILPSVLHAPASKTVGAGGSTRDHDPHNSHRSNNVRDPQREG